MKKRLGKKLRSRAGETISETLVSLLVASLALVMLAGAIAAATRVIVKSKNKLDSYYGESNTVAEQNSDDAKEGLTIQVEWGGGMKEQLTYNAYYYENDEFTSTPVISYQIKKDELGE